MGFSENLKFNFSFNIGQCLTQLIRNIKINARKVSPLSSTSNSYKNQAHTNMHDNGTVITNGSVSDGETDFGTKLYFTDVRLNFDLLFLKTH